MGKVLLIVLSVSTLLCLILLMPFSEGAVNQISKVVGKPVDWVKTQLKRGFLTGAGLVTIGLAFMVGAALPIVGFVVGVVALAAIVYAWYPVLFDSDTMPDKTTISDEVDDQDD